MKGRSRVANDGENESDLELLSRVALRDRSALDKLYRSYHPKLFRFIFKMTGSYESSEELVNDIMLVVWNKAADFRGESRVSTWIFGIAYKSALNHVTRRKKGFLSLATVAEPEYDDSEKLEQIDLIMNGVNSLSAIHQATVMLVFYLGLTYEEVAHVAGCPVNTVKTRMYHARQNLKTHLTRHAKPVGDEQGAFDE